MQSTAKRFDKLAVPKELGLLIVYTYNQYSIHIFGPLDTFLKTPELFVIICAALT